MHCWYPKDVCSIIFIMRHVAGLLFDGIRRVLRHVRSAICKCVALRCFYHAEFLCSLASNLSAVQSTLKVSETDGFCSNLSLSIEECCTRRHLDCHRKNVQIYIARDVQSLTFFNLFFYQIVMKIFFSHLLTLALRKSIPLHQHSWMSEKICLINYGISLCSQCWNWNEIYDCFL